MKVELSAEELKESIYMSLNYFGDLIKSVRISKGITIHELAKMAGVSPSVISDLENHKGVMSSTYTLFSISYCLGITPSEIINIFALKKVNTGFNKDKFRKLANLYNMSAICEKYNISRETVARLQSSSKKAEDMTVETALKLARGMNLDFDVFIRSVYDF